MDICSAASRAQEQLVGPGAELSVGHLASAPAGTPDATYQRMPPRLAVVHDVHGVNPVPDSLKRKAICMTRAGVGVDPLKSKCSRTVLGLRQPTRAPTRGVEASRRSGP